MSVGHAGFGVGIGISFASFLRFWAVAASRNSSRAPVGPRSRSRSSLRMRLRWANSISIFLRFAREGTVSARPLVEHSHVRLDTVLVYKPAEHFGRAVGAVAYQLGRVEIEATLARSSMRFAARTSACRIAVLRYPSGGSCPP